MLYTRVPPNFWNQRGVLTPIPLPRMSRDSCPELQFIKDCTFLTVMVQPWILIAHSSPLFPPLLLVSTQDQLIASPRCPLLAHSTPMGQHLDLSPTSVLRQYILNPSRCVCAAPIGIVTAVPGGRKGHAIGCCGSAGINILLLYLLLYLVVTTLFRSYLSDI